MPLDGEPGREPKPRAALCAVAGCTEPGRPRICPYDNRYHHHGCIHYSEERSALHFRDGWHWVCDEHFKILCDEREKELEAKP